MDQLTFEKLPEAITLIYEKLNKIEQLLQTNTASNSEEDQILTTSQAAAFLNLSIPTVYSLVSKSRIPICKQSKRLYFSRNELIKWIKDGRKKTNAELDADATNYIRKKARKDKNVN